MLGAVTYCHLQSTEYNEHESDCKVEELQKEVRLNFMIKLVVTA